MRSRHVIGQVAFAAALVIATVVACGGSTTSGIPSGSSSSGASGSSSGSSTSSSGSSGEECKCAQLDCGPGFVARTHEGQCCPTCDPIPDQCEGKPDSCLTKKGCAGGYERFEYAPGCCECRLTQCSGVTCPPFKSCLLGEHADLSGCCGVCVKDTACQNGATPCSTYQCPVGYKPNGLSSDGAGCCSSCEVDPNYCSNERTAFDGWLTTRLADPLALKCATKEDCQISNLSNACRGDCGHAVAKSAAAQISSDVAAYAKAHCSTCPPELIGCPAVVLTVKCADNKCALGL